MTDPVYAADVLLPEFAYTLNCDGLVDRLLACGGGDPVVIMPDGTLRRLKPYSPYLTDAEFQAQCDREAV